MDYETHAHAMHLKRKLGKILESMGEEIVDDVPPLRAVDQALGVLAERLGVDLDGRESRVFSGVAWRQQVMDLLSDDQMLRAIMIYREHTGLGLKEAHTAVMEMKMNL